LREKINSFLSFISEFILDLTPSTPFAYLLYLLIITLVSLALIFYLARKTKKNNNKKEEPQKKEITIDHLLQIASNPKSTLKDLLSALVMFNEMFSVSSDVKKSLALFKKVLNHKNRNKALFDYFHGNILPKNLQYKDELDKIEKEALNKS